MHAESLIAVLLKSPCSDDDLIAFLPLLLKSTHTTLDTATNAALFTRVGGLIGASPYDDDEKLRGRLSEYYAAHPPPAALQRAVEELFKQSVGGATADAFDAVAQRARAERHEPIASKPVFDVEDSKEHT